ncbi:MAG TPA: hypothetical protein VFI33_18170 [Puia sp.]|nr:hypothetical protein [Puia sp.]
MKKILCLFLLFPLVCICQVGKGTIKGVVKYYLSDYHLNKADIGSKVYVLDSVYAGNFNIQLADTFKTCLMYRSVAATYTDAILMPLEISDEINKYRALDDQAVRDYYSRNLSQLLELANNQMVNKSTVDGAGNYSIVVPKGTYYVFIQSNNKNIPELFSGETARVFCKKIRIDSGQTVDVSYKFSFY